MVGVCVCVCVYIYTHIYIFPPPSPYIYLVPTLDFLNRNFMVKPKHIGLWKFLRMTLILRFMDKHGQNCQWYSIRPVEDIRIQNLLRQEIWVLWLEVCSDVALICLWNSLLCHFLQPKSVFGRMGRIVSQLCCSSKIFLSLVIQDRKILSQY